MDMKILEKLLDDTRNEVKEETQRKVCICINKIILLYLIFMRYFLYIFLLQNSDLIIYRHVYTVPTSSDANSREFEGIQRH